MGLGTWTATKPFPATSGLSYHAIAYGNDDFVAVGPVSVVRSRDEGATWINDTAPPPPATPPPPPPSLAQAYTSVAYGGGVFVAVGNYYTTVLNGTVWSTPILHTAAGPTNFLRAIAYGTPPLGGLFVAVGDAGTIVTSPNGSTWAKRTSPITGDIHTIAYGNQLFVAAADSGAVLTSPDGVTWTVATTTSSPLRTVTFGNNAFLGVDQSKTVWKSSNGVSWTNLITLMVANAGAMSSIIYGFDTFAVVGPGGSIRTSLDGMTWTPRVSACMDHLGGIAFGRNRFVAVSDKGDIVRSGEYPSADLSALTCSGGPLTPAFNPLSTAYQAQLASNVATVTPTSEDPQAVIRVRLDSGSNVVVASGTPSAVGQVFGGRARTFYITVTARNSTTKLYTLAVYRSWLSRLLSTLVSYLLWAFRRP
jgi:photosystem II stability/assembly factor-like uncharacterized protein